MRSSVNGVGLYTDPLCAVIVNICIHIRVECWGANAAGFRFGVFPNPIRTPAVWFLSSSATFFVKMANVGG